MEIYECGDAAADSVLIQPVDARELAGMERESAAIRRKTGLAFRLAAVPVADWSRDLSPWRAEAVFRGEAFGGGAAETLADILTLCPDDGRQYIIGGYSLAGLFSLWAACCTDRFSAVAAASPSVWFPGFVDYLRDNPPRVRAVSLSLGDKEERTAHPVMRTVGERIRETQQLLRAQGIPCALEWNPGGHFKDPEGRTANAFACALEQLRRCGGSHAEDR